MSHEPCYLIVVNTYDYYQTEKTIHVDYGDSYFLDNIVNVLNKCKDYDDVVCVIEANILDGDSPGEYLCSTIYPHDFYVEDSRGEAVLDSEYILLWSTIYPVLERGWFRATYGSVEERKQVLDELKKIYYKNK